MSLPGGSHFCLRKYTCSNPRQNCFGASAIGQSTVCTITVLSCHANNVNQDLWEILDGVGTLIKLIYHTVNKDEYKKSDILPERLCQRYRLS